MLSCRDSYYLHKGQNVMVSPVRGVIRVSMFCLFGELRYSIEEMEDRFTLFIFFSFCVGAKQTRTYKRNDFWLDTRSYLTLVTGFGIFKK